MCVLRFCNFGRCLGKVSVERWGVGGELVDIQMKTISGDRDRNSNAPTWWHDLPCVGHLGKAREGQGKLGVRLERW